jgi:hypothetical protein
MLCTDRCEPKSRIQLGIRAKAWMVGLGGQGGLGDGPWPPGALTGLTCQGTATFMVAIALSNTITIAACWLSGTEHTSCLY